MRHFSRATVMQFAFKILSLLLLVPTIAVAMLTTGAWPNADHASAPSTNLGERIAPCHVRGLTDSSPTHSPSQHFPASYLCCLTDHVAAVVHASDASRRPAQFARIVQQIQPESTASFLNRIPIRTIVFADPPGTTPLRI